MQSDEARVILGFPPNSHPSPSKVKEAYKKKVWESHPDLFPLHQKPLAESKFKLISEAYTHLLSGIPASAANSPYFHRMLMVGQYGQVMRGPSSQLIFGRFLQDEIATIKEALTEFKEIIYAEAEQFFGDQMDERYHKDQRSEEMVTLAGWVEHIEVDPAAGVTTDDDRLDFLDDELTDQ